MQLIAKLRKTGTAGPAASPTQHLVKQNLQLKHRELLQNGELVMPLKYKYLAQQMGSLDSALSFLKHSRKQECVHFSEVCESVKASFGRDMNVNIFRQILTIVPEFYTHAWINNKLTIDTTQDLRTA